VEPRRRRHLPPVDHPGWHAHRVRGVRARRRQWPPTILGPSSSLMPSVARSHDQPSPQGMPDNIQSTSVRFTLRSSGQRTGPRKLKPGSPECAGYGGTVDCCRSTSTLQHHRSPRWRVQHWGRTRQPGCRAPSRGQRIRFGRRLWLAGGHPGGVENVGG
jgi:hypothetical protein